MKFTKKKKSKAIVNDTKEEQGEDVPSQEEMDRSAEIREQAKAERKAELKKFRQEHNTPFWWIMRILFFGGLLYLFIQ